MNAEEYRNKIIDGVKNYVNDCSKYAVMINGSWGCGKTFLYENYILKKLLYNEEGKYDNKKENIYISLYGISSINDLANELTIKCFSAKAQRHLSNMNPKNLEKTINITSGVLSFASKAVSIDAGPVSIKFDEINKITSLFKTKKCIICFDDLERSSLPINELFGFFSVLLEHCECKIIILSDEKNIGKMYANQNLEIKFNTILTGNRVIKNPLLKNGASSTDQGDEKTEEFTVDQLKKINEIIYSDSYLYHDIKEKVIGLVWDYLPNAEDTLAEMVKNYCDQTNCDGAYKEYINDNKKSIVKDFEESRYDGNFRFINVWLEKFYFIYLKVYNLLESEDNKTRILNVLIDSSIALVVARGKNYTIQDIDKKLELNTKKIVFNEEHTRNFPFYDFIESWYICGIWDKEDFQKSCNTIINNINERQKWTDNSNASQKLIFQDLSKNWLFIEDDKELDAKLQQFANEMKVGGYQIPAFSDIIAFLSELINDQIIEPSYFYFFANTMKRIIDSQQEEIRLSYIPPKFDDEKIQKIYDDHFSDIINAINDKNKALAAENKIHVYDSAETFSNYCEEHTDTFINAESVLSFFDIDKIAEMLKKSSLKDRYHVINTISNIYRKIPFKNVARNDVDAIDEFDKKTSDIWEDSKTNKAAHNYYKAQIQKIKDKLEKSQWLNGELRW